MRVRLTVRFSFKIRFEVGVRVRAWFKISNMTVMKFQGLKIENSLK